MLLLPASSDGSILGSEEIGFAIKVKEPLPTGAPAPVAESRCLILREDIFSEAWELLDVPVDTAAWPKAEHTASDSG